MGEVGSESVGLEVSGSEKTFWWWCWSSEMSSVESGAGMEGRLMLNSRVSDEPPLQPASWGENPRASSGKAWGAEALVRLGRALLRTMHRVLDCSHL